MNNTSGTVQAPAPSPKASLPPSPEDALVQIESVVPFSSANKRNNARSSSVWNLLWAYVSVVGFVLNKHTIIEVRLDVKTNIIMRSIIRFVERTSMYV